MAADASQIRVKRREIQMDYSLAMLKLLCAQLKDAREVPSRNGFTLGGLLFQHAWLQGVLVSAIDGDAGPLVLDDGTGLIELSLSGDFRFRPWRVGMYEMVVGGYLAWIGEPPMIKVHKMVDYLSSFLERAVMWYLEVLEAYKMFYQPLIIEEFT